MNSVCISQVYFLLVTLWAGKSVLWTFHSVSPGRRELRRFCILKPVSTCGFFATERPPSFLHLNQSLCLSLGMLILASNFFLKKSICLLLSFMCVWVWVCSCRDGLWKVRVESAGIDSLLLHSGVQIQVIRLGSKQLHSLGHQLSLPLTGPGFSPALLQA